MPSRSARSTSPAPTAPSLAAPALERHAPLLLLVAIDVATKLAAWTWLPHGRVVDAAPGLRFFLAINEWGVMGGPVGMPRVTAEPAYTLMLALGLALLSLVVLRLGRSRAGFGARVAMGAAAFGVVAVVARAVSLPFADQDLPAGWVVPAIRASVLLLAVSLYAASRAPRPRAAFTLLAAGALANAASSLYPPFEVIDFLIVPLAPFLPLLGAADSTSGADAIGVINVADLYLFAFPFALLAWPVLAVLRRRTS